MEAEAEMETDSKSMGDTVKEWASVRRVRDMMFRQYPIYNLDMCRRACIQFT
jgi:hypothetical protein